jgi:glycosyltransferase involved in cell wall biosynthesis
MKISYLSTFYPLRGGIAQFNAALYREFEKLHEIEAITFKRQYPNMLFPGETQYVTENDTKADKIISFELLDSVNPFSWYSSARRIRDFDPDLLIMKFWMPFFGPSLGTVSGRMYNECKRIAILDNVIPHEKRFYDIPATKYFLKRTDGYIVMSEKVRDDLLSLKPDAKYRLVKHPLYDHFGEAVDKKEARAKLNLDQDKKTLLFFGFIRDYKGLDLLIDAFDKLDNNYQLVIAGEVYGSFDKYEELIQKNKNKERIHKHVKYIGDDEVPLYFSAADTCILPYKSATQSGITSISFHFELPMLATDVGGLKELIQHEKTGIIIPEASAGAISKGIEHFFNSDNTDKFKNNIRAEKAEMSWEYLAKQIIALSKDI